MQSANLLDLVHEALQDRNIKRVAYNTQISKTTIHAVKNGCHKRAPHTSTLNVLADYLGVNRG